ncbi:MAG: hypothetical protein HY096_13275 [Nitrospinae bacterium]|nr:hypothetical protein [Nitrospinota bacterium]
MDKKPIKPLNEGLDKRGGLEKETSKPTPTQQRPINPPPPIKPNKK